MIKSVGSVFENSIIADSTFGHLFNLCPFLEPAANMIYRRNLYVNISTTGAGACGACQGPQAAKCMAGCPNCAKHQPGCNHTAMTKCRHACKARCDVACGTHKPIPGQPMPLPPAGVLDTTINSNTIATLQNSARLSGRPQYGFEAGPPSGSNWPPLSVNDTVIKEWDFNGYFAVANYTGPASSDCPAGVCSMRNFTHGESLQWDAHAIYEDPMLMRRCVWSSLDNHSLLAYASVRCSVLSLVATGPH